MRKLPPEVKGRDEGHLGRARLLTPRALLPSAEVRPIACSVKFGQIIFTVLGQFIRE